jgi:hypothetical protein
LRLKISQEDSEKLFNFIDKSGNGTIGYDEFTLLDEERWRKLDNKGELTMQALETERENNMER